MLNGYYDDDPIGSGSGNQAVGTGFTQEGVYVVNGNNVTESMLYALNAQGELAGVAFSDGDGNWDNEVIALGSGIGCFGSVGLVIGTSGAALFFNGAVAAGSCILFGQSLADLSDEYDWFSNTTDYADNAFEGICYDFDVDGAGDWDAETNACYMEVADGWYIDSKTGELVYVENGKIKTAGSEE
jgi:hypothetical protein